MATAGLQHSVLSSGPTRPQVTVVEGASHWLQQDRPEEVNRLLRTFIGGSGQ